MPYRYVLEMFCDRIAASMVYRGKDYDDSYPLAYYESGKHSYIMNSETRALLEYLLVELKDQGLEKTFKMINTKKGYEDYHLEDGL